MNNWWKSAFGASGLAVLIAIAANGKNLVGVLQAVFEFLVLMSKDAPLGLKSYLMATALAVLAQAMAVRWSQAVPCPRSREFALSLLGLLVGFGVMALQLRTLNGVLLGLMAGMSAPFVFQAIAAAWAWVLRPPTDPPATPKEPLDE